MARTTHTIMVDDLDHGPASETVRFSLDRVAYEIDLNADHAAALRRALSPYRAAARRGDPRTRAGRAGPQHAEGGTRSRAQTRAIRDWAHHHGQPLSPRGRIPEAVTTAYQQDDPSQLPAAQHPDHSMSRQPHPAPAACEPAPAFGSEPAAATEDAPDTDTDTVEAGAGRADPLDSAEAPSRGRDGLTRAEREHIRRWALDQGIEVKPRGQLKRDLISNYRAWTTRMQR